MKDLVYKYFRGETTTEETRKVVEWFETSDQNRAAFLREHFFWDATATYGDHSTEKRAINKGRKYLRQTMAYAAGILILIMVGLGVTDVINSATPGMQTVYVPAGQRVNLLLSDGTSVWLNSNTTFSYPAQFGKRSRKVTLRGEAYFDVKSDDHTPFIVSTGNHQVVVLGTTFNVNAYPGFMFETTLVEGSVKIVDRVNNITMMLRPDERASEKNGRLLKTFGINKSEYSWQEGILTFNDEPIDEVINQLSAYYGQKIHLDNILNRNYRCTAKFMYNDGVDYILKVLQRDLHYTIVRDSDSNSIRIK